MAFRHDCSLRNTPGSGYFHSRGSGKGPTRCQGCKGRMVITSGVYTVQKWRGDGDYSLADAIATSEREASAQRVADSDTTGELVVRFLSY